MRSLKKLLAAAMALTLVMSMAGCSGSDQKEGMEASAEVKAEVAKNVGGAEAKADAAESVEEVKEPKREIEMEEDVDYGIEIYNENGRKIIVSRFGLDSTPNACRSFFCTEESAGDEIMEIQDVRLWKESVPFSASHGQQKGVRYLLKAGKSYFVDVYVGEEALNGHELADCDDIEMDVKWGETAFSVTIPVAEVNQRNRRGEEEAPEDLKTFFIEEQEAYNVDVVRITVPEQKVSEGYVDFNVECNWDGPAVAKIQEIYVNGELLYTGDSFGNAISPNEPIGYYFELGKDGYDMLRKSTSDTNEISFNMVIKDPFEDYDPISVTVTLPVITKDGE